MSAAQADAFYREVLESGLVYTVSDDVGYPVPFGTDGRRAMPFWSKRSRAQKVIATASDYANFQVDEIELDDWRSDWLPDLERDGLLVGLNWSGKRVTGYDLSVSDVLTNLDARDAAREGRHDG